MIRAAQDIIAEPGYPAAPRSFLGAHEQLMSLIDRAAPSTPDSLRNWRLWMEYWARASHFAELADVHSERYAELPSSTVSGCRQ